MTDTPNAGGFAGIDYPPLCRALERQRIFEPTAIQARTLAPLLAGRDLDARAPTGAGKTLAFLLPLMQQLQTRQRPAGQAAALVVSPTRELARQIVDSARRLCERESVNVVAVTGGEDKARQGALLADADLLVATPGRLAELLDKGAVDLSGVTRLVVDEADRTLDMGFAEAMTRIALACHPERQTALFSATGSGHTGSELVAALTRPDQLERVEESGDNSGRRQQKLLTDDWAHRRRLVPGLLALGGFNRAIVFANKRERVDELTRDLQAAGLPAEALHGELDASRRKRVMQHFTRGDCRILVASDLAARGLDVSGLDLVVNAELPHNTPSFIHRAGRTARAGREGTVVSLVGPTTWDRFVAIEHYLGQRAETIEVAGLQAHYRGPKKLKASGKAAGTKSQKTAKKKRPAKAAQQTKGKQRHRDRKNIGKRRSPNTNPPE